MRNTLSNISQKKYKKKEYIKTKEFIEKTATEKFGLLYPGEYLLKGSDD